MGSAAFTCGEIALSSLSCNAAESNFQGMLFSLNIAYAAEQGIEESKLSKVVMNTPYLNFQGG